MQPQLSFISHCRCSWKTWIKLYWNLSDSLLKPIRKSNSSSTVPIWHLNRPLVKTILVTCYSSNYSCPPSKCSSLSNQCGFCLASLWFAALPTRFTDDGKRLQFASCLKVVKIVEFHACGRAWQMFRRVPCHSLFSPSQIRENWKLTGI